MGVPFSVYLIWTTQPRFAPGALHFSFHPELCVLRLDGVIGKWEVKSSTKRNVWIDCNFYFFFFTTCQIMEGACTSVHGLQLTFFFRRTCVTSARTER